MNWLMTLLTDPNSVEHVLFVYAAVIALGMALGRIKVFGVSLGVSFVLFAGLAASYVGITVNPTGLAYLRDFGLALFVFSIGLQVGPSFFSSFKRGGMQLNLLALLAVAASLVVTILLYFAFSDKIDLAQMLGVHYGAVTNTPGLGATQEALAVLGYQGDDIAVAYACAYPLGVVGIIGTAIALRFIFRINVAEEDRAWELAERASDDAPIYFQVKVTNSGINGQTIRKIRDFIGRPFICSRVMHAGEITSPNPDTAIYMNDHLRIVAGKEAKAPIVAFCGQIDDGPDLAAEQSPLISRRVTVTKVAVNGTTLADLHLSRYDGVNITRVFRAGMTLFPFQQLHLQIGDVVYCVGPEKAVERLAVTLGNQSGKLNAPNVAMIFLGVLVGVFLGAVPIALPGMPVPLKLGLAGGPLIVAILLGYFGPQLRIVTYMTQSANLILRELGIALFLASVGLAAGNRFVAAIAGGQGLMYMAFGFVITVVPILVVGIVARLKYKLNYHAIVGLIAGATTDPPTLAFAGTLSEKNISTIAYSTVYPLSMFLRILSGQLVLLLLWSFVV